MTIVACPRCRDEVQLPAKVSAQARVRCPLCRDEYILSEALAKMPPMLIVLDAGPEVDEPAFGEPEYKMAGASAAAADSAMGGMFDSSPAVGEAPVAPAPRPLKGAARPKRKSGGAVGQIVQVVLGGVLAVVLFQPVAWYLLKTDPFSTGPLVAKYAPGIVPKPFHGKSSSSGGTKNSDKLAVNTNPPPAPKPAGMKSNGNDFNPGENFKKQLQPNNPNPLDVTPPDLDLGPMPVIPPEPTDPTPPIKPEDPTKVSVEPPSKFTPPMPPPVDPNLPTITSTADITAAYGFAVNKREDFEAAVADKEERQVIIRKGQDLYEAAANLGKLLAEGDLEDPLNVEKVDMIKDELALKMTNGGTRFTMLTRFADQALAEGATEESVAIAGVIKSIKPLGATHETTIEVNRGDSLFTVPIVTLKSLEDGGAKVGDTLIVLGKIVRDPKKDLPKYKGEAPQIVQAGHTTLISAP